MERCAIWNEAECGPRHGAIRGSGGGVMRDVCGKWWGVECGVLMCDMDCYAKHGSGMWNWA